MTNQDKKKKPGQENLRGLLNASSIGIALVASILIGTAMGVWLDGVFDTKPWLTLIFMVLGIISGFRNVFWFLRRSGVWDTDDDNSGDGGATGQRGDDSET